MDNQTPAQSRNRMGLTAALCAAGVAGMLGLAFAAPPLYEAFCRVTGFGGTTQIASKAPAAVLDRAIEVRFDSNVAPGSGLTFEPLQRTQTLKLGETGLAFYRVTNPTPAPVTAVATYNVTPHKVGLYFQKLECFCFQQRVIQPGETMELPVVFYVDPELATDVNTQEVTSIALSYTFFRSVDGKMPALPGAAALGAAQAAR